MKNSAVIDTTFNKIDEITCGNRSSITIHLKGDCASIRTHQHIGFALQAGASQRGTNRLDRCRSGLAAANQ